jgi:cytochrome P450
MEAGLPDSTAIFIPPAPTPRSEPLRLIALLSTLKVNPLEAWTQAHFEQPIVMGGLSIGRVAVVSDPAAIRRVLLENSANYQKDWMQRRILSAGLASGLLSAEGNQWKAQRRALAPLFSRKTVLAFSAAMIDSAQALVERLARHQDQVVDVAVEATRTTLDVLERTIFSDGFGRAAEEIRIAMKSYFDTIGRIDPLDLLGLPAVVPRPSRWRLRPMLRLFEGAIDTIISTRRRQIARNKPDVPRDILTFLLEARDPETGEALSEAEIRANILTFIAAGQETTANCITWSLFLLSQSPEWRQRIQAEADREFGDGRGNMADRLVETRALVEETNRLYPPLAAISRAALGPDELAGQRIRRGTMVVIAPYVLHRHRALWTKPDCFDPNRFLNGAREKIDRYAYLPFGAGPRICIGATFAIQEATIVLAAIMRNFNLELAPGHAVWPVLKVTLRPKGGLPMIVRRRIR